MRPASVVVVVIIRGLKKNDRLKLEQVLFRPARQRVRVEISIALINGFHLPTWLPTCIQDLTPQHVTILASRACQGEAEAHHSEHNLALRVAPEGLASGNPGRTTGCLKAAS
jgi:hypothetical protein